ncbi:TPA: hypothetical protein ACOJ3X_001027 [Streptococcus pneumoniae]
MIYNDTSDRSGCHRERAASEILMMTSSVMRSQWVEATLIQNGFTISNSALIL